MAVFSVFWQKKGLGPLGVKFEFYLGQQKNRAIHFEGTYLSENILK